MRPTKIFLFTTIFLLSLTAAAQEDRHEVSIEGTGLFTKSAVGNGVSYQSTDSGGFLSTYRYHLNRWVSAEGAYGYSLATEKYLSVNDFRIRSGVHEATGALVLNLPSRATSRFSPFVLAGAGALLFQPTSGTAQTVSGAQTQAKPAFLYGAGINFTLTKHISVRGEYRGFLYETPDLGFSAFVTNSMTHTAQPSVGISFRF